MMVAEDIVKHKMRRTALLVDQEQKRREMQDLVQKYDNTWQDYNKFLKNPDLYYEQKRSKVSEQEKVDTKNAETYKFVKVDTPKEQPQKRVISFLTKAIEVDPEIVRLE